MAIKGKLKKDLLPKGSTIAMAAYVTNDRCFSCQKLEIMLGGSITRVGFHNDAPENAIQISKNLRAFLEKFEESAAHYALPILESRLEKMKEHQGSDEFKEQSRVDRNKYNKAVRDLIAQVDNLKEMLDGTD